MKKIFIIGGMGAGKSTARKALVDLGLKYIDLDQLGHAIHEWDIVKEELREAFGDEVFDEDGAVNRRALANAAFVNTVQTRKLNRIMMPRIEDAFDTQLDELEAEGCENVVVEYSVFKNKEASLAYLADVVIAVLAPLDLRIERAVAAGWDELDVRRRLEQQITDAERIQAADVVFNNEGTPEELYAAVKAWWLEHKDD